jgi:hypothetical protein
MAGKMSFGQKVRYVFYESGAPEMFSGGTGAIAYMQGALNGDAMLQILGAVTMVAMPAYKIRTLKSYRASRVDPLP